MKKTFICGGNIAVGDNGEIATSNGAIDHYAFIGGARIPVDKDGRIVTTGTMSQDLLIIVTELPETGEPSKIYLLQNDGNVSGNVFDEYIWINNEWEKIGTLAIDTTVDLSNYYDKSEVDLLITEINNTITAELGGLSDATTDLENLL
jgi:hypothetical protein